MEVAAEKNSTLVMPFPVELLRFFSEFTGGAREQAAPGGPGPKEQATPVGPVLGPVTENSRRGGGGRRRTTAEAGADGTTHIPIDCIYCGT